MLDTRRTKAVPGARHRIAHDLEVSGCPAGGGPNEFAQERPGGRPFGCRTSNSGEGWRAPRRPSERVHVLVVVSNGQFELTPAPVHGAQIRRNPDVSVREARRPT